MQPPLNAHKRTKLFSKAAKSKAPTLATPRTTLFNARCPSPRQSLRVLRTSPPAVNVRSTETMDIVTKYWALRSTKALHKQ